MRTERTAGPAGGGESTLSENGIKLPIREFISRSFDGREVADEDDIFAVGFGNSLFAMQLVAFVEREFSIEIESEDLDMANFRSIEAVSALVERKRGATSGE